MRKNLEAVIESVVNKDTEMGKDALHEYIRVKTRSILLGEASEPEDEDDEDEDDEDEDDEDEDDEDEDDDKPAFLKKKSEKSEKDEKKK